MGEYECPCVECGESCDEWESQFCCEYCRWLYGDTETPCDDCDPADI